MTEDTVCSWLALIRCPGYGTSAFRQALDCAGSASQLLKVPVSDLKQLGLKQATVNFLTNPDWTTVDADLKWLEHKNNHLVTIDDPLYPSLLREIPDPPLALFITGHPEILDTPQIAVIGSRNPSRDGKTTARNFARALAQPGLTITSGLAIGIDEMGHRGALDVNAITIAVTATGLDQIYPARHYDLAQSIIDRGALISEFPTNTPPKRFHFPKRNRIIAGLSLGTLVVEAASQSGSLITARLAIEYGRELFAIPGSIHNPLARGCHALIKQGAKLVETAQDIAEEFSHYAVQSPSSTARQKVVLDETQQHILENIDYSPTTIDQLVELCSLPVHTITSALLILELNGLINAEASGSYVRIQPT
ncbi:MAG: DNA-processing protein DprA [Gammaproteobacteria bacterium]|nr:DNA-processing protein DprA [Gammaproteobacteria bacterium]